VLKLRPDPFPFEAARDLLGILRAMFAAARASGAGARRIAAIRQVGLELRAAIELALEHEPETLGHARAWDRAERATRALASLIDCTTPLEPTLDAAARRVRPSGSLAEDRTLRLRDPWRRG
jgi:hypothetical protein